MRVARIWLAVKEHSPEFFLIIVAVMAVAGAGVKLWRRDVDSVAVVMLALAALAGIFVRHLSQIVARIRKISPTGALELDPSVADEQKHAATTAPAPDALLREAAGAPMSSTARDAADRILGSFPRNEYVVAMEQQIDAALKQIGLAGDDSQRARILPGVMASLGASVEFERIYGIIFGSQLKALHALNATPEGMLQGELLNFYETASLAWPDVFRNYSFQQYLGFLRGQDLVAMLATGGVGITPKGRAFLLYLTQQGRSFERAG